jgi:vacuolar-type H+-ATPase subunit H
VAAAEEQARLAVASAVTQSQQSGREEAAQILAASRSQVQAIRETAARRLPDAVKLVMERIVSG